MFMKFRFNKKVHKITDMRCVFKPLFASFGPNIRIHFFVRSKESNVEEFASSLSNGTMGAVNQFIDSFTILVKNKIKTGYLC